MFIITFITGILLWGIDGIDIPKTIITSNGFKKINIIESLSFKYLSYFVTMLNFTVLVFCISSIFNSVSVSYVISISILFFGASLSSIFKNYNWYKYLYFSNLDISIYLGNYNKLINGLSLKETIIKQLICMLCFIFTSFFLFKSKEIKSKN